MRAVVVIPLVLASVAGCGAGGRQPDALRVSAADVTAPVSGAPDDPALTPPAGPATPAAVQPPAPGDLSEVDWSNRSYDATCRGGQAAPPVFADLDADGATEAFVPVSCPDRPGVTAGIWAYTGRAVEPRLLGDALPVADAGRLHAIQVRDGHLVVTTTVWSGPAAGGEPDLAVTSRWVLEGAGLRRTDRWIDPAHVLEVDAPR